MNSMKSTLRFLALVFVALALASCKQPTKAPATLNLITTTSTQDSGLLVVLQVRALGAGSVQAARLLAFEARRGIIVAVLVGFGHALSEVGAAMMLGGNIAGETRVLTTATILAARMGKFDLAVGLASLLFAIALLVNGAAVGLQPRART